VGERVRDDDDAVAVGEDVVIGTDVDAPDGDRLAERFGDPLSDDVDRCEVPAPDRKAQAKDEFAVSAAAVDDVPADASERENRPWSHRHLAEGHVRNIGAMDCMPGRALL
jgi:hypothetical protein